jgi:anhydro-N-acetylmuramic acid kinase
MQALGLMSGTSLDGVDVALLVTDGEIITGFGPSGYRPYSPHERDVLKAALREGAHITDTSPSLTLGGGKGGGILAQAEKIVNDAHMQAVQQFCSHHTIDRRTIDVIGFHGQTIIHKPEHGLTVQIGDGPALAAALGCTVVYDFRAADVAAGGQGAPLVPVYHQALAAFLNLPLPVVFMNIGGVANMTYLGKHGELLACDTGPGNALLDDLVFARTGNMYDQDGALALAGTADQKLVQHFLRDSFFALPPPKSLDRNRFQGALDQLNHLDVEDAAATLTAFTAAAMASVIPHLPAKPALYVVAGGGAFNPALLAALRALLDAPVTAADEHGLKSDVLEAQAFAFLAVRSLNGMPLTFEGTTGVRQPQTGGKTYSTVTDFARFRG